MKMRLRRAGCGGVRCGGRGGAGMAAGGDGAKEAEAEGWRWGGVDTTEKRKGESEVDGEK